MNLARSKAAEMLMWLVKAERCSVQEPRAGISHLHSVTGAGGKKGVGSGQGDLSKDYTPYLHNKDEHWNTWAPPGTQRCPSSHRCPLGRINGNHSGQNTVSSLSSVNDFSASADYLQRGGTYSDQLHSNSVLGLLYRVLCFRTYLLTFYYIISIVCIPFSYN